MVKDIKLIERVQRRATNMVQGIQYLNYDDRLNYFGVMLLEKRRVRNDLIETFKFMKGMLCMMLRKRYLFNWMTEVEEDILVLVDIGRRVHWELLLLHLRSRRFLKVFTVLALATLSGSSFQ